MCLVFDASGILRIKQFDLYGFQPFGLSFRSAHVPFFCPVLPAVRLYVCLVLKGWFLKWNVCLSGSVVTFFYQLDLDAFQTLCVSFRSRGISVLRPVKPSECLRVYPVIDIEFLLHVAGKTNLYGFQPL